MRVVNPRNRLMRLLALGLCLAMVVMGCSSGGAGSSAENIEERDGALYIDDELIADAELWAAAKEEGSLTLYSTYSEVLEVALIDEFQEQTGISVENVRLTGPRMYERIEGEQAAGQMQADVIRRSDLTLVRDHVKSGVFAPHCPPAWDKLIRTKDPQCLFWASNETPFVIGYNTALVNEDEAPKTWDDLLNPRFGGGVQGVNNITSGGTTWSRDSWLRMTKGIQYWEALAKQDPHISTSSGSISDLMARGEIQIASVLIGAQGAAMDNGAPLEIVFPTDGIPSSAHYLGLTSGASNPNAGKVFLNWNASLAGQTAMATIAGDYAIREDAPPPQAGGRTFPARSEINLVFTETLDETEADRNRPAWISDWLRIYNYTPE